MRAAYSTAGRGSRTQRAVSTARYTATSTPAKTSALTNQVAPNSSANCTMFFVSSSRNAAPMNARSRYPRIRLNEPPPTRMSTTDPSRIRPSISR